MMRPDVYVITLIMLNLCGVDFILCEYSVSVLFISACVLCACALSIDTVARCEENYMSNKELLSNENMGLQCIVYSSVH